MKYFSLNYKESREKFVQLVEAADGKLESITHDSARGPSGEALSIDVAVFGEEGAAKAFVDINGTHGNESYSGAAGQLQLLASEGLQQLPGDISVILVHCVNPYGWAYDSQLNENLVNLNRNFIDFDATPDSDELHLDLERALAYEDLSYEALYRAISRYHDIAQKYGEDRFQNAFMTGQYIAPATINYGGAKPEWSNLVLRDLATKYLSGTEKIAYADWHTGLGAYGQPYELPLCRPNTPGWDKTADWWGEEAVIRGASGVMTAGEAEEDAAAADFNGLAFRAIQDAAPGAEIAGGIIEYGTITFETMLQGCILDLWLMFNDLQSHPEYHFWKMISRETLAPSDPAWHQSILKHSESFHRRMLDGLVEWD